jgi:hypothetical protein
MGCFLIPLHSTLSPWGEGKNDQENDKFHLILQTSLVLSLVKDSPGLILREGFWREIICLRILSK